MIVFGHLRGLIVIGVISGSPTGLHPVFALGLDGCEPHLQSLGVFPEVLRRPVLVGKVLVPAQDRQRVLDGQLQVPGNVSYALSSSGVEGAEVSGSLGSADESDPGAAPDEFFASVPSLMNGRRASLMVSFTSSG